MAEAVWRTRQRREVARRFARAALAAPFVLAACGDQGPMPRPVDLARIAGDQLATAVLDECHAPLLGQMDSLAARVTIEQKDMQAWIALPDQLRANDPEGPVLLLGDQGHRLLGDQSEPLTAAATARLRDLRTLLDSAAFGPLHRAVACARIDVRTFRVTTREGSTWTITLRANSLLPEHFVGPGGTVEIKDYLRTDTTWVCRRAAIAGLGECAVRFESPDIHFDEEFFALPAARPAAAPKKPLHRPPGAAPEERPTEPTLQDLRAHALVVFQDPGDWPARTREYKARFEELQRQDQQIAGFVTFFGDGVDARMAVPFRARDGRAGFEAPPGWQILEAPKGRQLVVFPASGSVAERAARGREQLEAALRAQGLTAAGPVRWQPYFDLHKAEPTAAELAAQVVRVSVPLRD